MNTFFGSSLKCYDVVIFGSFPGHRRMNDAIFIPLLIAHCLFFLIICRSPQPNVTSLNVTHSAKLNSISLNDACKVC